jgi:hypothetical protein
MPVTTDVFPFRRLAFAYTAAQVADYAEQFWECSHRSFQLGNRLAEAREAVSLVAPARHRRPPLFGGGPPAPRRHRTRP